MVTRNDWLADMKGAFNSGNKSTGNKWAAAWDWSNAQMSTDPVPPPAGEQAIPADSFVERIGINTHLNWRSTVWGQPAWRDLFKALGVRYTRSLIGTSKPAADDLKYINAKILMLTECANNTHTEYDEAKCQSYLNYAATNFPDLVEAIGGPNEPNNGHSPGWDTALRDFQAWLYEACEANAKLADRPVLGPSVWKRLTADYQKLGDMSDSMDVGDLHYYTGGCRPTVTAEGDDSGGAQTLDQAISDAGIIAPNLPIWITETGWPVNGAGCPLGPGFVTPRAQAKYCIRMLCENYIRGVQMSYLYTLIDDDRDPPRYHGFMTQSLEKRPAFGALQRTIACFADPNATFEPGSLPLTLTGDEEVSYLPLMQRSDGVFLLGMWQDVDSYNRQTYKDIEPPPIEVTIDVGSSARFQVRKPTFSDEVTESEGQSAIVGVPDHLMVVEITLA